jgi:hypothetical protein
MLSEQVRSYLNGFRPFEFPDQDCEPGAFCTPKTFWGDEIISRFFAWIGDKYLSFAVPLLLTAIGYGRRKSRLSGSRVHCCEEG